MKNIADMTREELESVVSQVVNFMYNEDGQLNPDKEHDSDVTSGVDQVLSAAGLKPDRVKLYCVADGEGETVDDLLTHSAALAAAKALSDSKLDLFYIYGSDEGDNVQVGEVVRPDFDVVRKAVRDGTVSADYGSFLCGVSLSFMSNSLASTVNP